MKSAASGTFLVTQPVQPFAGGAFAISVTVSTAATVGTLTATFTVNGTASTGLTVTVAANAATAYSSVEYGGVGTQWNAGDKIGVQLTTSGTWNGTASDVLVEVFYNLIDVQE
jgi:hypothetical protein